MKKNFGKPSSLIVAVAPKLKGFFGLFCLLPQVFDLAGFCYMLSVTLKKSDC